VTISGTSTALVVGGVDLTPYGGTFTGTLTGCTTSPTATFTWERVGKMAVVTLGTNALTATSNSNACTITGLPAAIQPSATETLVPCYGIENNGVAALLGGALVTPGSGTITLYLYVSVAAGFSSTGFTSSGAKGVTAAFSFSYTIA
jgi:hypothetical protein